jgi:uncharacterized membrane protein
MVNSRYWTDIVILTFSAPTNNTGVKNSIGQRENLNIIFLMCIAFLPFATSVLDEFGTNRSAVIFYATCMTLTGVMKTGLWCYAAHHHRLIFHRLSRQRIRRLLCSTAIPPIVFLISIGIAFGNPLLAKTSWVAISLILFVPQGLAIFRRAL